MVLGRAPGPLGDRISKNPKIRLPAEETKDHPRFPHERDEGWGPPLPGVNGERSLPPTNY